MRKRLALLFFALALVCLSTTAIFAQVTATATLQGTVTDKSGAVIPGADVKITNKQTGEVRSAPSSGAGLYTFNLLPAGTYEVRVSVKGFSTAAFENVELAVGRTTTIDAQMTPSAQAETVTVEAAGAALVDTVKTDVSLAVTPAQVQELPLNGRDFANLALLAPGARPVSSYDPTKNRIAVFATNGSSGRNVNVTVNGIDDKDGTVGGPVMQLPLEAIQEFNISTQRFSAANGRSEGAAVNLITKSGTNNFHGSIYFFDRDQAFDTLNYFEQASGVKAPFSRQQFGGSIGGPVQKDKTFLFFALERSREQTSVNALPAAYADAQALANINLPYGIKVIPVQTIATPYYDWRYNGRVDHHINEKNTFSASYSNQNNTGLNDQSSSTSDGSQNNFTDNQLIIANASWNSVLSPTVVNSATVGYQYWHNLIDTNPFLTNATFPNLAVGTNPNVPQESVQRKWQFRDDVAITHGKHSFKTGFDYLWEPQLGGFFITDLTPVISFFDDPTTILSNTAKYPQGLATPGAVSGITQATTGNSYFYEQGKMFGVYFQDDWKVNRRVTINLGLRWDKDFDLNGGKQQANARSYLYLKQIGSPYAQSLPHDDNKNFSPRFGLAWDLTGAGKHVVRFGYGLYFGQTFINIPLFMEQQANPTIFSTTSFTSPGPGDPHASVLPNGQLLSAWRFGIDPLPPQAPGGVNLPANATGQMVDPNYRNPYSEQWNGGYSWQVTSDSVIEAEYVHTLGLHESKTIVLNPTVNGVRYTTPLFQAAGLPLIAGIRDYMSIGRSRYDAMNLSYRKRFSRHFSANAAYVLSKGQAYNGNSSAFGNSPTDEFNWFAAHDYGPTPADERHRITFSGIFNLPWGIEFAPIMQWATARPYNATEGITDVFAQGSGVAATHAIVLNSDPTNLTATVGYSAAQLQACIAANTCQQLPYNFLRGEDFFQLDARFSKMFTFKERMHLQLIFQAFDMTNRANFGSAYQGNIRQTNFLQPTGFICGNGVICPKSFAGEFGAKFSF
jgi:hypothetical protein